MTKNPTHASLSAIPTQWQELNVLWEQNKLPQKNFCKIHGVDYKQFISWRGKIVNARGKMQKQKQFAEVSVLEPTMSSTSTSPPIPAIKICFPDGTSVHIPSELGEQKLLLLISSLRGES